LPFKHSAAKYTNNYLFYSSDSTNNTSKGVNSSMNIGLPFEHNVTKCANSSASSDSTNSVSKCVDNSSRIRLPFEHDVPKYANSYLFSKSDSTDTDTDTVSKFVISFSSICFPFERSTANHAKSTSSTSDCINSTSGIGSPFKWSANKNFHNHIIYSSDHTNSASNVLAPAASASHPCKAPPSTATGFTAPTAPPHAPKAASVFQSSAPPR
jgi:hypothetical protein